MPQLMMSAIKPENTFSSDHVTNSINEFKYDPEEGITFEADYRGLEQIFEKKL